MTHAPATVAVWDLPTRIFHWLLPLLVLSAWVSYRFAEAIGDETLIWHRWNGLTLLTLIAWRLIWGFAGPRPVRWVAFVHRPAHVLAYARGMIAGSAARYLGHNPLGAYMVIALIAALLSQASLGLFATDENELTGGPLYRLVSEQGNASATRWHGRIFDYVLLPLIALHVASNMLHGLLKREALVSAMINGRKPAADYADGEAGGGAAPSAPVMARALTCLAAAIALVAGAILASGGRL